MNIKVTARSEGVTNSMKEAAREKAAHLTRYYTRVQSVEVILQVEGERHIVEGILHLPRSATIVCKESNDEMVAAIDLLMSRLEQQLRRHKEKVRSHRFRKKDEQELVEEPEETYEDVLDKKEL